MYRFALYAVVALILMIGNAGAQTAEDQRTPVKAKEPTVVTVEGKRGQVPEDKAPIADDRKKPNAAKRIFTTVGKGLHRAWNAAVDATEWTLGMGDVTEKRMEGEAAK
jgi:hypothetical protein